MARELSRTGRDDGYTDVVIALGATQRMTITVPTSILDGPGYQDMLDAALAKQGQLRDIARG
jgi:hypothetical protein